MKFIHENPEKRKLVAVLAIDRSGIFLPKGTNSCHYLNTQGMISHETGSLEFILREHTDRTPIYEGDKITIQF